MHLPTFLRKILKKPWRQARKAVQGMRQGRSAFWRAYPGEAPLAFLDPRIVINHQRKFIYFRIPKAANSTVMASLYASDTGQVIQGRELYRLIDRFYVHPSRLSAAEMEELSRYTAFTVVRHPVRRLLSAYRDKIVRKKPTSLVVFRALKRDPAKAEISLEDFVGYLEDGGLMGDRHWMPQRFFLPRGFRPMDMIGKVESLAEDLPRILAKLYPQGFQVANYRAHATGADQVALDPRIAQRIAALYAEDFAVFGYER